LFVCLDVFVIISLLVGWFMVFNTTFSNISVIFSLGESTLHYILYTPLNVFLFCILNFDGTKISCILLHTAALKPSNVSVIHKSEILCKVVLHLEELYFVSFLV